MYFDCNVEDEASVTTEPSTDQEQSRGQGWGRGLGQGGPSGHPVGLPDDVGESDGMLCYGIFPAESLYKTT